MTMQDQVHGNTFQELRASKPVEEGEELTDCYLDLR